jgi:hypothetical protein
MRRTASVLGAGAVVAAVVAGWAVRRTAAQEDAPVPSDAAPTAVVDKVMGLIGSGQIDDALSAMPGLNQQQEQKAAAQQDLIRTRDAQFGTYRGYDVATTVRFTPRFQAVDVLGNYDKQPVLFRFEFYKPQDSLGWQVEDLRVDPTIATIVETLREDAPGLGAGRGGRATR